MIDADISSLFVDKDLFECLVIIGGLWSLFFHSFFRSFDSGENCWDLGVVRLNAKCNFEIALFKVFVSKNLNDTRTE